MPSAPTPDHPAHPLHKLLPAALLALATRADRPRGAHLFRQGQRPSRMHFVLGGEVVLQRPGINGEPVVLQRVRQGLLAEASLQAGRYHCDAVCTAASHTVSVPVAALREALQADAAFAARWIAMLGAELRRQRAQCERLSRKGVAERLLHLIETEGSNGVLPVPSSLVSLAAELSVTHEALYRTLAQLEAAGRLARRDGRLCLL